MIHWNCENEKLLFLKDLKGDNCSSVFLPCGQFLSGCSSEGCGASFIDSEFLNIYTAKDTAGEATCKAELFLEQTQDRIFVGKLLLSLCFHSNRCGYKTWERVTLSDKILGPFSFQGEVI